jgi:predicted alpha/beta hydrolase family esterase
MRVIGIHGYKSAPGKNFWPWLERELRGRGFEVVIPELPNPAEPDRDLWTQTLLDAVAPLSDKDIIVGHSLGGAAALRFLEAAEARTTPHACVLISTPWMIRDERFSGFFLTELDHDVLMWRASKFVVLHAKDDSVIPVSSAQRYADIFHARLVTPELGGHFDGESYPDILNEILRIAQEPIVYAPGQSLDDEYVDVR